MNKRGKLKCCNYALLVCLLPVLATGIILECGVAGRAFVLVHVVLAVSMMSLAAYHLYLHVGSKGWWQRVKKLKSHATRLLVRVAMLAAASGLVALVAWLFCRQHTSIGGLHGVIGFFFLFIAAGHTLKRWKWFS